jgi:hypothetical protein
VEDPGVRAQWLVVAPSQDDWQRPVPLHAGRGATGAPFTGLQ